MFINAAYIYKARVYSCQLINSNYEAQSVCDGIFISNNFINPTVHQFHPSPPRMFLSLDLLSEYRIQRGAIGPLYVTSGYSTWTFCRGVSGFATDCPCDIWCRGLTTCLLHVGPPFRNWLLNTSWAVGLTYWIVYLHFFCILTYAIIYVLIHHIIFWLYLYFLNILYFFKYPCTNIFHRRFLCNFYAPLCYINVYPCAYFYCKMVHCGIFDDAFWNLWDGSLIMTIV